MTEKYVFFWQTDKGGKIGPGCFSQWARHGFVVDNVFYRYAEQFMMAEKARLFDDKTTLDKIMAAKSPMIIKRLGRSVKGRAGGKWDAHDAAMWDGVRFDAVVRGNFAKFSQNDALKEYLLLTGDAMLAEASPYDAIWGIGIDAETAEKTPQSKWPGKNLLGKALMKVREMLKSGAGETPKVKSDKELLAQYVKDEGLQRMVNAEFSKAKSARRKKSVALDEEPVVRSELECEALSKLDENKSRTSDLFVTTRKTLLRRVNAGDKKAFEEFYNVYCPSLLNYLGLCEGSKKEKDQWDLVQTVFAKFYKAFAMVEDPDTGAKRIPKDLLSVLVRKNGKTGQTCEIKFRQYLVTCLKNAVYTKWRRETKRGKVNVCSIDTRIASDEKTTWKDLLEDQGVDPKRLDDAAAENERMEAAKGIWSAVMKGFLLDESLDDSVRDITYRSIAEGVSTADLAKYWGLKENYVYQIKHRALKKAAAITKEIYGLLGDDNDDVQGDVGRLCESVSQMKPGKHIDKFMIALAKELYQGRK